MTLFGRRHGIVDRRRAAVERAIPGFVAPDSKDVCPRMRLAGREDRHDESIVSDVVPGQDALRSEGSIAREAQRRMRA